MTDLTGKTAVVLGASAEGGTGWAVAKSFAAAGARVVIGARNIDTLQRLAAEISGQAVQCDAGDESQVAALADVALNAYGRIDIGVNAAGLPVLARLADVSPEQLHSAIQVNYFGQVFFLKHMARVMRDGGSLIAISSISSTDINGHFFPYACAKAAANCLVRYAAVELAPRGIRVNAILPGPIRSDMARPVFAVPGVESALQREIPLGRVCEPADLANTCLWLAGPAFITGECLQVNGGMHLTRFPYADEVPGGGAALFYVAS
jgi:NAD(P)-dependent dehydrogenase (short-subunit alcohol dehydrogenase family)